MFGRDLRWGDQYVQQALGEPTDIDFFEIELGDVVDYLCERHKIYVVVEQDALADVGLTIDTPVSLHLSGVPFHSALEAVLKPLELNWTVCHGVLLITTDETAQENRATRVYDVADLVTCRDENDALWEDYDTLIETITKTIEPGAWVSDYGTGGAIKGVTLGTAKALVVSQNEQVHRKISTLLEQLRSGIRQSPGDGKPPRRPKPPTGFGGDLGGMGGGLGGMGGGFGGMGGGFF